MKSPDAIGLDLKPLGFPLYLPFKFQNLVNFTGVRNKLKWDFYQVVLFCNLKTFHLGIFNRFFISSVTDVF